MPSLLAVDLGLRAGLAVYRGDGRLADYGSTNFGSRERLRRAVVQVLARVDDLRMVVTEGDRLLGDIWHRAAVRLGAVTTSVSAEVWRDRLLLSREQHSGALAKQHAELMARRVIAWSKAPAPTSLRHDAAEAILIGLWAVLELGWLEKLPPEVTRR